MTGVMLNGAKISSGTLFPKGFNPIAAGAVVTFNAPKAQTITFKPLPLTYGSSLRLTATSSSKLPVSYLIGNTNLLSLDSSGTLLTPLGIGTTTVTAMQRGNTNTIWATPKTQTVIIRKASQTITFGKLPTHTYGEQPFSITATSSIAGLQVTFKSSNPKVALVSGNTVTLTGAGKTTITVTQAGNSLYNAATPVSQVLNVKAFR